MTSEISEQKRTEFISKFKEFLHENYETEMITAAMGDESLEIDYNVLHKYSSDIADLLLIEPDAVIEIIKESIKDIDLPNDIEVRFSNHPEPISIRNLRSKHIAKFICVEGTVRRASEIRPEIIESMWECSDCGEEIIQPRRSNMIMKPFQCTNDSCRSRKAFKQIGKKMVDTRWITIEEPFELTEGDRPSQVTIVLIDDLVSPEMRRITDPGNRLKISGILREMPKGKWFSTKLEFYMDANHVEPVEISWHHIDISEADRERIKNFAKDPGIYETLVDSLAPSLYGLREIKESIILQLFGGVPQHLKDGTHIRGDIHILLIGDPASGKSQLLKLVPEIVPRARYVSGKGVTAAGLTASVIKDELFMGGWVLEAGAMVLANKGVLSIDEFEKMSPDDMIAMHEALEQGTISIAKASIVATLPAKTSVLAGGNPKFSRFDPYMAISKQITIPDSLLSRFDLKFALRDIPDSKKDKLIVEHILDSREEGHEKARPKIEPLFIRKYIAYAKEKCSPILTKEASKVIKAFYLQTRKKAEGGSAPIPITLRQFEALVRLSEASAKIQLSDKVRRSDADRAIKLMRYSLHQLGFDPETGMIDIDRADGASTSSSERNKIKIVLEIINDMSEKKKEISVDELTSRAKVQEVDDVDDIIEKLKREGMLFEPNPGFVQKI
ncbi:MAG: minichromosome maintenance protein MCM [Nanoarchaeota archaeon]|nr:minichromosome maintenance protein MCM [Nanoarchaeota archaeon]MBU1135070.1 minichromosome maintenance protein MCM [Nanoarchaeota archaeon]MBU2519980.1 minichromosome maintenance protein MCM [Nanoarchaeota archaeon]